MKVKIVICRSTPLFEVNWDKYFDCNITVNADLDLIYKRLFENRNMSKEDVDKRLKTQLSAKEKLS